MLLIQCWSCCYHVQRAHVHKKPVKADPQNTTCLLLIWDPQQFFNNWNAIIYCIGFTSLLGIFISLCRFALSFCNYFIFCVPLHDPPLSLIKGEKKQNKSGSKGPLRSLNPTTLWYLFSAEAKQRNDLHWQEDLQMICLSILHCPIMTLWEMGHWKH